ncbi:MAG: hypothetical protein QOH06_5349 [Acidobacteriota bacterium]|nr:hypothetical protein [Acidobacteriota bacterium]
MPRIVIRDAQGRNLGAKADAVIGSRINWSVAVAEGGAATDVRWAVAGVNPTVAGYTQAEDRAAVQPAVQTAGAAVTWYWAKTGSFQVTVRAVVDGHSCEYTVTVKVVAPTILSFESATDEVKIADCKNPTTGLDSPHLTFGGDTATKKPGICWTVKLIGPPCSGEVAFTQLMKIHRRRRTTTGAWETNTSGTEYVLDEVVHYDFEEGGEDDNETATCMDHENLKLVSEDSPGSPLYRNGRHGTLYDRLEVKESFRTHLMFKPTGGIWAGVGLLEWSWSGTAVYENGEWTLAERDWTTCPTGTATVRFPVWTRNRNDIM